MQNRTTRRTSWAMTLAIVLAGIGFSAAAAPAEAGPFKEIRKYHERQLKKEKKFYKEQRKYEKKQLKYYKKQQKAARKYAKRYGHAYPGYYAPAPVVPGYGGAPYAPYSSRGFSFGFGYYR